MAVKQTWFRARLNLLFWLVCSRKLDRLTAAKRGKRTYISFFTLSFRAGVYGTKTGGDLRKIYLPFSIAQPRKLQRLTAAKRGKNNILPKSIPLTLFVRYFSAFFFLKFAFYL